MNLKFARQILYLYLFFAAFGFIFKSSIIDYPLTLSLLIANMICMILALQLKTQTIRTIAFVVACFCLSCFINWARSPKHFPTDLGIYNTSHIMTGCICSLTTFFTAYMLRLKGLIKPDFFYKFLIVVFVLNIGAYFLEATVSTQEESTHGRANNVAYILLYTLLALHIKGFTKVNTLIAFITFALVIAGAKRGAILCMIIIGVFYFYYRFKNSKRLFLVVAPVVVSVLIGTATYIYSTDENLQTKVEATEQGDTSGREYMNAILYLHWLNSDLNEQIFGYQFAGSIALLGMDAHNDWLEFLIGQGVVGVLLYFLIFLTFLVCFLKCRRWLLPHERFVFISSILFWFSRSFVSQACYSGETLYLTILFAILMVDVNCRKKELIKNESFGSRCI